MASKAQIQTVKAEFLDPSLYDDAGVSGIPRLSRGTVLAALSRAFDLAEGRRPGHAQRVAYVGIYLAGELNLDPARVEEVFFACLLHDVGMAATPNSPPAEPTTSSRSGWADVLEALATHCDQGSKIVRKLGLGDAVSKAVASHHDCWDGTGPSTSGARDRMPMVSRVVAVADRFESMIDADGSPLMVRKQAASLIRDMSGSELDPKIAGKMADVANRDGFWLGFYDNDLSATLMSLDYGGTMAGDDLFGFLSVISDVVDIRNGREPGRGRRVADFSRKMALICDMTERRADLVRVAALLQDIGTLGVPVHYLSKPDILTIDEMSAVQLHPTFARDILGEIPGLGAAAWWVGCHHERIDGKGYPGMLEGDEVPIEAQIIGLCEAYDALTSDRPYRRAMASSDALQVMQGLAGTRFGGYLLARFESIIPPFQA